MSKFRKYQCDICRKTTEEVNDTKRVFLDKCDLTKGCRGTLRFVSETDVKSGIVNYQEDVIQNAGVSSLIPAQSLGEFITTLSQFSTSSASEVTLAVLRTGDAPENDDTITVVFNEIKNQSKAFKEYVYSLKTPFSTISGKDDSAERKVLTFSSVDDIQITINGTIVDSSLYTYQNNIITFDDVVVYNTFKSSDLFVRVLVSAQNELVTRELEFRKTVQNLVTGSWSNVDSITVGANTYDLFTCIDLTPLKINTRMTFLEARKNNDSQSIDLSSNPGNFLWILLANEPFTAVDRIETTVIDLEQVVSSTQYLKIVVKDGKRNLLCSSDAVKDIFPTIAIDSIFSVANETVADLTLVGDDSSLNNAITKTNSHILGPV